MNLLDDIPLAATVGLDTAPIIYYIEAHARYGPIVQPLFVDRIQKGDNTGVTSTVSLAEVLVQPLALGRMDLVKSYRDLLTAGPHLVLSDITPSVAERSADLRGRSNLRLPDAFQMAAALEKGATLFLTNEMGLRRVTELRVLVLDDYLVPGSP